MGTREMMYVGKPAPARAAFLLRAAVAGAIALALSSCASFPRTAFSEEEQQAAEIPNMPDVRFFADAPFNEIMQGLDGKAMLAAAHRNGGLKMLAISGGAWDGAYGAGVVTGWTKSGKRPEFTVVTGVSAGSLIAPFAFLGPDYDAKLADAFTSGAAAPIGDGTDSLLSVIGERSMRRNTLHGLISRYVDLKFLGAVAAEHKRGRRLLVVTTNLDAQRAVVWNMGAIASAGGQRALELFKDILTASSSIPGVFEPTRITAYANGRGFEELHVDGGVTMNVFTLPDSMLASHVNGRDQGKAPGSMYVIMNTRLTPEFEVVEAQVSTMLGRSLSTLLKAHSKATVLASLEFARSTGIDFNLTHIDTANPGNLKPSFNTDYMRAVYTMGYRRAARGDFWEKTISLPGENRGRRVR